MQPCEVVGDNEDVFLQNIDVEKLVHELQVLTGTLETPEKTDVEQSASRFTALVPELEIAANVTKILVTCANFFAQIWSSYISNNSASSVDDQNDHIFGFCYSYAPNSLQKQKWAVKCFKEWRVNHNQRIAAQGIGSGYILKNPIECMADGDLIFSLIQFIYETHKQDGTEYPSETLYALIMNLQGHLHTLGKEVKFLEEKKFKGVHNTLEAPSTLDVMQHVKQHMTQTAFCNNSAVHTACNQVMCNATSHSNLGPELFVHILIADNKLSKQP